MGLFPGFVGESIAPVLSRLTARSSRIDVREVLNYSTYASHDLIFNAMGFGHTPDDTTPLLTNTDYAASAWIGTATVLAEAMGLQIQSVEGYRDVAITPRALSVAAGEIPAGTVGAMRFGVVVDCGDTTLAVEHLTRMADDLAPDWPTEIGYEVTFQGEPNMRFHLVDRLARRGSRRTRMPGDSNARDKRDPGCAERRARPVRPGVDFSVRCAPDGARDRAFELIEELRLICI